MTLNLQPGLSGNPFLQLEKRRQKRLGTEDG